MNNEPFEEQDQDPQVQDDAAESVDIAALKAERDALQDRLLRTAAEFDNYRKRIDRERRTKKVVGFKITNGFPECGEQFRAYLKTRLARHVPHGGVSVSVSATTASSVKSRSPSDKAFQIATRSAQTVKP